MKKLITAIVAAVFLILTLTIPVEANKTDYLVGDFSDLTDAKGKKHWAYEQMTELIAMGLLKGYTNGQIHTIRPAKNITRAEFAVILYEALNYEPDQEKAPFTDEIPAWAETAVDTLFQKGIIKGSPDGSFRPQRSISRAEIATMLVLAAGRNSQLSFGRFWDVPATHWAYNNIQTAAVMGFINGMPDGSFAPDRRAQRAEVMVMLYNYFRNSKSQQPQNANLVSRADMVSDGLESLVNDDEGADINTVLPFLTGEMEEYMADGESQSIIENLKNEGLLGYRITSPGKVVSKSDYLAEVEYNVSVTFKNDQVNEEVNTALRYYLMKMGNEWYVYKEDFE